MTLSVMFLLLSPLTILISTAFIFSKVSFKTKLIVFPLLGGLIPVLLGLPLSNVATRLHFLYSTELFASCGPFLFAIYIIILTYLKERHKHLVFYLHGHLLLFVVVPFAFIYPQALLITYPSYYTYTINFMNVLVIIGIFLIILYVFYSIVINLLAAIKRRRLKKELENSSEDTKEEIR